jgi:hypothetical protein
LVKKASSVAPTKAAFKRQSGTNTEIGHEVNGSISTEVTMSGGIDNRVRPVIRIVMQYLHLLLFLIAHVDVLVDGASPGALVGGAVGLLMSGGKNVITATTGFGRTTSLVRAVQSAIRVRRVFDIAERHFVVTRFACPHDHVDSSSKPGVISAFSFALIIGYDWRKRRQAFFALTET